MMKEITISENDIFYKDMIDNMKIYIKNSENILNSKEYIDFERKMNEFLNHSDRYQYIHDNFRKIYIDSESSIYINMIEDKYKDIDKFKYNSDIIDISLINEKRIKKELDLIRIKIDNSELYDIFIKTINLSIYDLYHYKYNDFLENIYQNEIIIDE